jgi:hypothetical protein
MKWLEHPSLHRPNHDKPRICLTSKYLPNLKVTKPQHDKRDINHKKMLIHYANVKDL